MKNLFNPISSENSGALSKAVSNTSADSFYEGIPVKQLTNVIEETTIYKKLLVVLSSFISVTIVMSTYYIF